MGDENQQSERSDEKEENSTIAGEHGIDIPEIGRFGNGAVIIRDRLRHRSQKHDSLGVCHEGA